MASRSQRDRTIISLIFAWPPSVLPALLNYPSFLLSSIWMSAAYASFETSVDICNFNPFVDVIVRLGISFLVSDHFKTSAHHASSLLRWVFSSQAYFFFQRLCRNIFSFTIAGITNPSGSYCLATNYKQLLFVICFLVHREKLIVVISSLGFHGNPRTLLHSPVFAWSIPAICRSNSSLFETNALMFLEASAKILFMS